MDYASHDGQSSGHRTRQPARYASPGCFAEPGDSREVSVELREYLPSVCEVRPPVGNILTIIAPTAQYADNMERGMRKHLRDTATRTGCVIHLVGGDRTFSINPADPQPTAQLSSYGASRIRANANMEEVLDFIKGQKAGGLIVTVTQMKNDKCLMVNDLQALDRGGGWTAADWIGIDFKTLWRDSFLVGRKNFYGDLISTVERDRHIPNFEYEIRRPSGALASYSSSYHYVEAFMGVPVRVAVSRPGDWRIVQSAPDGSE